MGYSFTANQIEERKMKKKELFIIGTVSCIIIIVAVLSSIFMFSTHKSKDSSDSKQVATKTTSLNRKESKPTSEESVSQSSKQSSTKGNAVVAPNQSTSNASTTTSVSEDVMESVARNFINTYYPSTNKSFHDVAVSMQTYASDDVIDGLIPNGLHHTEQDINICYYLIESMTFKKISSNKISADVPMKQVVNGQGAREVSLHFELTFGKDQKISQVLKSVNQ